MQGSAVFGVETAPEEDVVLAGGYLTVVDEGLADGVELAVVVDHVGLVFYAALGGILDQFEQHLLCMLSCGGGANVLVVKLSAELVPVTIEKSVQGPPYVTLLLIDVPDNRVHFLPVGEPMFIGQLVVFFQEFLDRLADLAREVGHELGADRGHGGDAISWSVHHCVYNLLGVRR